MEAVTTQDQAPTSKESKRPSGKYVESSLLGELHFPRSLLRRFRGSVELRIEIHADGSVGELSFIRSSGSADFDEMIISAIRETRFQAATRAGAAVDSVLDLEIEVR